MKTSFIPKTFLVGLITFSGLALASCDQQDPQEVKEHPAGTATEAAAPAVVDLKVIDRAAGTMARENGMAVTVETFFAEDAIQLDDGKDMIDDGIRAIMRDHLNIPEGLSVSWVPLGGGVSESGDLGYTWGRWSNVLYDENNNMIDTYGKYVTIWKKQEDGSWKVAVDIWNSEDPLE